MKYQCCAYTGDTGHERCTETATLYITSPDGDSVPRTLTCGKHAMELILSSTKLKGVWTLETVK